VLLRPGSAQNACHRNVARLARTGEARAWCYGYALFGTTWHEHSWGLGFRAELIETTLPARRYYGIELPAAAAAVAG
jgi:hypothetical protein